MLDAIVQFVRNALCCCKDLRLFADTTKLFDPTHTARYYDFPEPLNHTTPLELLICTTQLYACISTTTSGLRLVMESGYGKLRRVNRLLTIIHHPSRRQRQDDDDDDDNDKTTTTTTLGHKIAIESLLKEQAAARRSIFVGVNVTAIGVAFFWLFANSLHITETDWIGGVPGLIHALTVMEVGLIPLLYFMVEDGIGQLSKAVRLQKFVTTLQDGSGVTEDALNVESYEWIVSDGWNPFWTQDYGPVEPLPDEMADTKDLNDEISKLNTTLGAITASSSVSKNDKDDDDDDGPRRGQSSSRNKMSVVLRTAAIRLQSDVYVIRMEGYREFLYFVLNVIAFYGYMLGILVYYYDQEEEFQPSHVRQLKFGLNNDDADWHGNFAGDLMWTIEPIVILTSPMLLSWLKPKTTKIKKD